MVKEIGSHDYFQLVKEIKERIKSAQYEALKAVNKKLIALYWDIGKMIIERQEGETWGKAIVDRLAADLQIEFPGISGFSSRNLWKMRDFYLNYHKNKKLPPLVAEIGWAHNIVILEKCKDDLEREFYIRMTRRMGWTKNVLIHQIENKTYEKTILNQTNFDRTLPNEIKDQARLAVKDEYLFDFLDLGEEHSERQLEQAVLLKIESFLREMGGLFSFIGSQYRLEVAGNEYFIDLLLYHRHLKCLVAIELKVGKFLPEYVGKMQFYLAALDDLVRLDGENPSIGIILCKDKEKTIVEYALRETRKPIGVGQYKIVSSLPEDLAKELPGAAVIGKLMEGI
jgi:predicted nuclease of restriction endonuclease-like (RecB) superfamily